MSELRRLLDSAEQGNKSAGHAIIKMFNGIWKENADIYDRLEISERKYKRHDEIVWKQADNIVELVDKNADLSAKIGEFESQVAVLRGALEFYADPDTYLGEIVDDKFGNCQMCIADIDSDTGEEARKALSTTPAESIQKVNQLEKYAELGRLAVSADICDYEFGDCGCNGVNNDDECDIYNFCQKRAESLVEV